MRPKLEYGNASIIGEKTTGKQELDKIQRQLELLLTLQYLSLAAENWLELI